MVDMPCLVLFDYQLSIMTLPYMMNKTYELGSQLVLGVDFISTE